MSVEEVRRLDVDVRLPCECWTGVDCSQPMVEYFFRLLVRRAVCFVVVSFIVMKAR